MQLNENRYEIQGLGLEELAAEHGLPLYVYDGEKILAQYNRLKNAFGELNCKIKYAAKALTNMSILKLLDQAGAGFDMVSINEIKQAQMVGIDTKNIFFTNNGIDFDEIVEGVEAGVMINIDNLIFLEKFGEKYGNSVPLCIRINPHIMAGGNSKIQVGHVGSKFGISILQEKEIHQVVEKYNLDVRGLHIHTGSDVLSADVFLKGAEVVFDVAKHFKNLDFLDFGSGFKVAYKDGDIVTDIENVGKEMTRAFKNFCAEYGKELEIWFEPGKFLVSESGVFLAKTNVIKSTPACTFVSIGSGQNHLIRPMMYGAHHDIVNISNPNGKEKVYNIVGYICETDTFGSDRKLNEVKEGDIIALKNAGAYCFSMSNNYNSRIKPAEVLIHNGKAHLIRKRETFDDIIKNQIIADI